MYRGTLPATLLCCGTSCALPSGYVRDTVCSPTWYQQRTSEITVAIVQLRGQTHLGHVGSHHTHGTSIDYMSISRRAFSLYLTYNDNSSELQYAHIDKKDVVSIYVQITYSVFIDNMTLCSLM